jgi:hypothetical protein
VTGGDRAAPWPETAFLRMSEAGPLTVRVRHEAEYVLVTVAGEADYASVAADEALGRLSPAAKAAAV